VVKDLPASQPSWAGNPATLQPAVQSAQLTIRVQTIYHTNGRAFKDISERRVGTGVDPWVQEAQDWLARCEQRIVHQSNNCGERRTASACPTDCCDVSSPYDHVVVALSSDLQAECQPMPMKLRMIDTNIWVSSSLLIVEPVVFTIERFNIGFNSRLLVAWSLEIFGESSARAVPSAVFKMSASP
jgi:hypothetical protein